MDRLDALRLFLRAVEAGTITGAGRRFGLFSTAGRRAHPAGYQAAIHAAYARGPAVPAKVTALVAHLRGPGPG